jgi:hypothetical protein
MPEEELLTIQDVAVWATVTVIRKGRNQLHSLWLCCSNSTCFAGKMTLAKCLFRSQNRSWTGQYRLICTEDSHTTGKSSLEAINGG